MKSGVIIKIFKIIPINYELKTKFEKKAILNSYKVFLKNCNLDVQIIVKSNKKDISKNIIKIKKQMEKEKTLKNKNIINISEKYINFLKEKTEISFSTSKKFYVLIKNNQSPEKTEEKNKEKLKEEFYKIKESLLRCGNLVEEITTKEELEKTIISFF